jgi:integrase
MTVTDDPDHRYQSALERLENADIAQEDEDRITEFLDAIDPDVNTTNFTGENGNRETKSYGTLAAYAQALKRVCELSETRLTDFENAKEVNELFQGFRLGNHPNVKDDGYGKSTLGQWESATTKFFQYHSDFGVDPNEIVIDDPPTTEVDGRTTYTHEEVQAMRDAVTNARDRAMLELLLNTGQRIRAIQTLRVKDVDTEEGIYYLNTDADGLKRADKHGRKRPLLGAKGAVYDWLQHHQGDRDDYLITPLPTANGGNHGDKLSQTTMRRALRKIAERAGVDKPPNPHAYRHYFVTVAKRDYGMDDTTIKHLIGHGQGSRIMETTYQHLSDDDHIKNAEIAADIRDEEPDESPLTPKVCPTCNENLAPDAKACPSCGAVFTPDAKATQSQVEEDMYQAKGELEGEEESALDRMRDEVVDEIKAELLEELQENQ